MNATLKYFKSFGIPIGISLLLYLIDPYLQGYLFGWILVVLIVFKKGFLLQNLDRGFVLITIFSFTYALFYRFDPYGGQQFIYNYAFVPPGFYLLGKYFVNKHSTHRNIFILLISIGYVFSFSAMISVLLVFMKDGFSSLERNLPMFWSGNVVAATKMGSFFLFNMCLPGLLLIKQVKLSLAFKIFGGVVFFLSLICVIRLGSRTQLLVSVITIVISVLYVLKMQSFKKNIPMLFMIVILIGVIATQVSFDKDADWMSVYSSRMDDTKNVASAGGRSQRWERAVENLFVKPMGWNKNEFGHAHNLWLDVAMIGGVMPMIFLFFFSVKSFFDIKKAIQLRPDQLSLNALILAYGLSLFLVFFVEPIMIGYFNLFAVFCIFMGVVNAYNVKFKVNSSVSEIKNTLN